jgi:excinuclease UvrABC nuclease subunit
MSDQWTPAYINNNTATTKRFTFKKSGVYLIRNKISKDIIYIGMSKVNVYKTLYRHFHQWNDYSQRRVTYQSRENYEVRVILVEIELVAKLEIKLIKKYKPVDNYEKYDNIQDAEIENENILQEIEEVCPF